MTASSSTARPWLRAAAFLTILALALAVDRSKFRTCENSGFCSRHRSLTAGALKYTIVPGTFKFDGTLTATVHEAVSNTHYLMRLTRYEDNIVRLEIDELQGLKPRYKVNDVLLDTVKPVPFAAWDPNAFSLRLDDSRFVRIDPATMRVDILANNVPVLSANQRGLFYFEFHREKQAPAGTLTDATAGTNPEDLTPKRGETPPGIDFSKAWEETFGGETDNKPHGPSSIGMDFSFIGAKQVYGIPEHATNLALKETTGATGAYKDPYRLYNLDVFEYEIDEPMALYGHVPFMMGHSENQTTGLFWMNGAETWVDVSRPSSGGVLTSLFGSDSPNQVDTRWVSETGTIDVFFMTGPTPRDVLRQFTYLVGRQELPPLFAVAYHQCRWNYLDATDVASVNTKFEELDIPYDVIWLDIEHTDGKRYFTWDNRHFAKPEEMIKDIAQYGRKMVTIVDPHIKRDDGYPVHKQASDLKLYIKDANGNDYDGHCWPGASSWLDFTDPVIRQYWSERFHYHNYKGSTPDLFTWNDMNEPSVFNGPEVTMKKSAKHFGGWEHRDVHNLYGMLMHRATSNGLVLRNPKQDKRPFVLSRAFYAGSQRWGAIWTGDNKADWQHLWAAQPMLMSIGLGGISFAGADVGGFFGNPAPELLLRWYQVGAYQPFFRAHAHLDTARREPWVHGEPWTTRFRQAILSRYQILPYVYTAFRQSSLDGSPVMRPIWFDYPNATATFALDSIYLFGSDLLIAPVVTEGGVTVEVVLPGVAPWYDTTNGQSYLPGTHTVDAPLEKIPVFQRGGSIIPRKMRVRRSSATMANDPYTLVIAPDQNGKASGDLYLDDYESYDFKQGNYLLRNFKFETSPDGKSATIETKMLEGNAEFRTLEEIERLIVRGVSVAPKSVSAQIGSSQVSLAFRLEDSNTLVIRDPNFRLMDEWKITIIYE